MTEPLLKDPPRPGEPPAAEQIARMIRVDQAGEYGARRIYEGQLAAIRDPQAKRQIRHMLEQELVHLDYFDKALAERRVRPTLLQPFWHVGGFLLGAATAAMGKEAAMACTVAVEEVIGEHYRQQEQKLGEGEDALKQKIAQFRAEELEHHDLALTEGAEAAPAYPLLSAGIRTITRLAIALSKKI